MKTKITFCIAAVALVTLSFASIEVENPKPIPSDTTVTGTNASLQVGGLVLDEVVK